MRDGRFHTVLGGVSSSFTSGSYSSEVLIQLLEVTLIVNGWYSLTPIQPFGWSHHDVVVEYSPLLRTVEGRAKTCLS